jgi:hypothetical protein
MLLQVTYNITQTILIVYKNVDRQNIFEIKINIFQQCLYFSLYTNKYVMYLLTLRKNELTIILHESCGYETQYLIKGKGKDIPVTGRGGP